MEINEQIKQMAMRFRGLREDLDMSVEEVASKCGITPDEFPKFAANARSTMGILFKMDRIEITDEDLVKIYTASYR